jgi:CheY-like chemotaxis protein
MSLAREFHPQVVLLDVGLPDLSGYEVARQLRELPDMTGLLIVALTGYGQESDQQRARAAGFDHHLTKPVEPATLLALLAEGPP